ncbi:MAG: glutamine amidotransferase [Verrucomicrobiota bacterium]
MSLLATIQWRPQLNPLLCGLLVLLLGGWLIVTYRRLKCRFSAGKSLALLTPKLLVLALLVFALFEPVRDLERRESRTGKLIAVTDVSSSMDAVDDGRAARRVRAGKILDRLKTELPANVALETLEFDTQLRPAGTPLTNGLRATDLGGCLVALAERNDISGTLGVVLLTDGGAEPVRPATLPPVPLTIIGIGTNPTNWNDIAIATVDAPATVEKDTQFEIAADLVARGTLNRPVTVKLEHAGKTLTTQVVDLSHRRARVKFPVLCAETGPQSYRLVVEPVAGELSVLNNERRVVVDVQKKAVHVLFFTRELGMDFKMLRSEIGRDPGIAFTALFRTLSERFTVQGERLTGDEPLEAGFPTDLKTLQLFDCVILGSFAASDWSREQLTVLTNYVAEGGAVIFLGGEKSFGLGGYAGTPVAALLPWQIAVNEPELARGTFAVNIPATGQGHPIVAGLDLALTLSSVNSPGTLKPGATALLSVSLGGRTVPVVAVQPFGKGRVLGIASNTQWEWARKSDALRNVYGLFWRQAVRNLTGKTEGSRYLAVQWDQEHYRPGEQATAVIRLTGLTGSQPIRLSATLSFNNQSQPIPVDFRQGRANEFATQCRFKERGEYGFRLVAYQGEAVLDSYEKVLPVAPLLAEGSRLELDEAALQKLAEKTGGAYFHESEADEIGKTLAARFLEKTVTTETPLVTAGPYFAVLVLALCVVEWWLRRKVNLI